MRSNYEDGLKAIQEKEIIHAIKYTEKKGSILSKENNFLKKKKSKKNIIKENLDVVQSLDVSQKRNKRKQISSAKKILTPLDQLIFENTRFLTGTRIQPMVGSARVTPIPMNYLKDRVHSPLVPSDGRPSTRNISTAHLNKKEHSASSRQDKGISIVNHKNLEKNRPFLLVKKSVSPIRILKKRNSSEKAIEKSKMIKNNQKIKKINENNCSQSPSVIHQKTLEILDELEGLKSHIKKENINSSKTPIKSISIDKLINKQSSKTDFKILNGSKIYVQAAFKGFLIRKKYQEVYNSAIIIQKHIRAYQCRKIYKCIKEAIICIQTRYREYVLRKR